jgi:hypothetical protein
LQGVLCGWWAGRGEVNGVLANGDWLLDSGGV